MFILCIIYIIRKSFITKLLVTFTKVQKLSYYKLWHSYPDAPRVLRSMSFTLIATQ